MKSFLQEFQAFAMKGNVIDLAVAVVIGGAFGKITTSLVEDIIMPAIAPLLGQTDFSQIMLWNLKIGSFINVVIEFIIIAFAIFMVVKAMNKAKEMGEEPEPEAEAAPAGPTQEELLSEIRDLLRDR